MWSASPRHRRARTAHSMRWSGIRRPGAGGCVSAVFVTGTADVPGCANCGGIAKLQANRARTRIWIGCTACPANTGWFDGDDAPQRALCAWVRLPPLVPVLPPTAAGSAWGCGRSG
ncbi:MAG TPA: hypothetical protein DEB32_06610 [Stenotrophomonas sp.]|nr:hypothetical protein [Stenotrophomonas sp.]